MKLFQNVFIIGFFLFPILVYSQHKEHHDSNKIDKEPPFRIALLIGHTLISEIDANENYFIPSWGFDLEYWFGKKWGIGLHNDLEIETFVIIKDNGEFENLERVNPLVITLDALYKPWKGLVLQIGPGMEFEKSENFTLLRAGIEYEFEIENHWDIAPSFFYDTRFGEYQTWSLALGIGKRF